jgi:hypothetical protein
MQFIATGNYADGTTRDLTVSVAWSSSSQDAATINAEGLASAVSAGETLITASEGGITDHTTLTVTSSNTEQPTKAILNISTSGTLPAGTLIGGVDISVSLAAGVSLKTTANPPDVDAGVVAASGVAATGSTVLATYSAPSGSGPGTARLLIANPNGFGAGEFATIDCDIAAGSNPQAADFSLLNFTVKDLNGAELTGLTPGFAADIR